MSGSVFDMPSETDLVNKKIKIEEELRNTELTDIKKEELLDELNDIRADLIEIKVEK